MPKMLTRRKVHNVSEGGQEEDGADDDLGNDDNCSEKNSNSSKDKTEDRMSFRSESSNRMRKTPSLADNGGTVSPILSNQRASRTASRNSRFVVDVSSEDTPLSMRQASSMDGKRKRLTLYQRDEAPSEEEKHLNSTEEGDDESKKVQYDGSETEKHDDQNDGVRRSSRARKSHFGSYNESWLFAETAKGYPAIKAKENGRLRTRRRERVVVEEEIEEDEEEEEEEDRRRKTRMKSKGKSLNKSSRYANNVEPKAEMFTYIKTRRLRSSNTSSAAYSGYQSTVRNAKKTPGKMSRLRRRQYESSTDVESDESEEDDELEVKSKPKPKLPDQEDDEEQVLPVVDGDRIKGRYTLRRIQPVDRYCPMEAKQSSRSSTPPRSRATRHASRMPCSPAHRSQRKRRQKAQNESSTSSSSSDEGRFERRKNKSMTKARNRFLPMNFSPDDLGQSVVKDRMKIGSSLADVDPMKVDREVTFEQVGGLETYIQSLKEMILFPLLYPEIFNKFSIQAPRGVLFYGPPGTGKTLVARCLANECSQKDRRVAFFMRKGADCLSKWVGESERQLRLLFDQAYQMRPSIIFFDEIDGLAPVRSTRQDQIHSSIVSTLLALMDGLDSRGEVIIIGATNRLDAIDPALRRPGRFDREFHFPLPSVSARKEILQIHLKSWVPAPPANLVQYLSQRTVGYCGADLKALCAEAALLALRRRYPQVYQSKDKLLLDLSQINVERKDFDQAVQKIVPASQRSAISSGKPLSNVVAPLLNDIFQLLIKQTQLIFPEGIATLKVKGPLNGVKKQTSNQVFPRLLVTGDGCSYIASSLLHYMERLPVHRLDLSTLHALSVRSPEEACVQVFQEARRNVPAIIYLPLVGRWWPVISETVRATFLTQLSELDPELPIMLLATDECDCPEDFITIFREEDAEIFQTRAFTKQERRKFFRPVLVVKCLKPPAGRKAPKEQLEVIPLAPAPPPRQLNEVEKAKIERKEEATLRELRIFLREILAKMARNRLFYMFTRPVDVKEVADYFTIIKQPMDLETMMTKIDLHAYESARDFLDDIELICANALEYNPDKGPEDKMIRHRACTLRDTAYALIKAEMDTDFEEQCQDISRTRKARQEKVAPPTEPTISAAPEASTSAAPAVEIKDNGSATKSEIRKARGKKNCWKVSRRHPAKKRKTESGADQSLTNHDSSMASMDATEVASDDASSKMPCLEDSVIAKDELSSFAEEDSQITIPSIDLIESEDAPKVEAETSKKTVQIDVERLEDLLDDLVIKSEKWNLEKLLRLYSKLSKIVDRYAKLWDRTALLDELEVAIGACR